MSLVASRLAGRSSPLIYGAIAALLTLTAACGGRGSEEIPYSTLKQHIAKGEVREVRLSATEIQAIPTEPAQAAGAPPSWVATPVASDNLVPLLEAKGITYGGLKEDTSRVTMGVGFLTGLLFIALIFMAYKRTNPVLSMSSLTRGRLRARDKQRARTKTSFDSVAGVDEAKKSSKRL